MINIFWSKYSGHCGSTTNLLSLAVLSAAENNDKNLLINNKSSLESKNSIENYLGIEVEENRGLTIDSILSQAKNNTLSVEDVNLYAYHLYSGSKIDLIFGADHDSSKLYSNLDILVQKVMKTADQYYDQVFLDTNLKEDEIESFFEFGDRIFISISQNIHIIKDTLNSVSGLNKNIQDKIIYIIGNYDENSKLNITNIKRQFKLKNLYAVNRNTNLLDSLNDGSIMSFVKSNLDSDKYHYNYNLMQSYKQLLTEVLIRR